MTTIDPFIAGMPKAELHVHIEGTIGPMAQMALAERNNVRLPYASQSEIVAAWNYTDLDDFLRIYYEGIRLLVTEQDFFDVTSAFLARCYTENVIHVEISFDPQPHLSRGIAIDTVMAGITQACRKARENNGTSIALIMCVNRDRPLQEAIPLFDLIRPWREQITGLGLDSSERGNPPEKFTGIYRQARTEGYRLTAHCDVDQDNAAAHIRQCLDVLGVERIDHGVNALDDPSLLDDLRDRDICLTVCPTWRPCDSQPRRLDRLRRLFDLGVRVTVNTDDPGLFASGHMNHLLNAVYSAGGYTRPEMISLMRNAFLGSWAPPDTRNAMLDRLAAYAVESDAT